MNLIKTILVVSTAYVTILDIVYHVSKIESPWLDGPEWQPMLTLYDAYAAQHYGHCDSRLIVSEKFGSTQIHACGNPDHPPVLLLHGLAVNSLMYGDWLVPELMENNYYAVAVDTICDMGRSFPRDGSKENCPHGRDDIVEWLADVVHQLGYRGKRVSFIGYSFGSFIATELAVAKPEMVERLVLFAPGGIFAPIELPWVLRAVATNFIKKLMPTDNLKHKVRLWFYDYMLADPKVIASDLSMWDLRIAMSNAPDTVVLGDPAALDLEVLKEMNRVNPTLLIIGHQETVINAGKSITMALEAGIQVQAYNNSGHLILFEYPRLDSIQVVLSFLGEIPRTDLDLQDNADEVDADGDKNVDWGDGEGSDEIDGEIMDVKTKEAPEEEALTDGKTDESGKTAEDGAYEDFNGSSKESMPDDKADIDVADVVSSESTSQGGTTASGESVDDTRVNNQHDVFTTETLVEPEATAAGETGNANDEDMDRDFRRLL